MTSLLPPEFNTVTLTGQYVNLDGTPVSGYLNFSPSPTILKAAQSKDMIVPVTIYVGLDANGHFSVNLPATDDPDINPDHWTYQVLEGFGSRRTYSVQILLEAGTTQNIFDLAPVAMANGTYYELGPTGPAGPPAIIVSGAPGAGVGSVGSYAIDPTAGVLYGPKDQVTGWPAGIHLAAVDIATHAALTRTHGIVAGSVIVGTTDTQTLSHKTLVAPVVTGGLSADSATVSGNLSVTGDIAGHNVTGNIVAANEVTVANAPSGASDATRKDYVDTADNLRVQIGGDLGGTPTAPTVTGGTHHTHTSAQVSDATSAPTASKVAIRDAAGRMQAADPSAAQDVATKNYVDTGTAGTSAPTASTTMKRDAAGRAQVADPSAAADIATKNYVDTASNGTSSATASTTMKRDAAGRSQVVDPAVAADIATKNYVDLHGNVLFLNASDPVPAGTAANTLIYRPNTTKTPGFFWGSGTAFPTSTALGIGDTFIRTDLNSVMYYTGTTGTWGQLQPSYGLSSTARAAAVMTGIIGGFRWIDSDTGREWVWTGSAWVAVASAIKPVAELHPTNSQSIFINTWTSLNWGVVDADTHGGYSAANPSRWTVPAGWAGTYRITGMVSLAPSSSNFTLRVCVAKNGAFIVGSGRGGYVATTPSSLETQIIQSLAVGDYVEIWAQQNSAANQPCSFSSPDTNLMTVEFMRP